LFAACDADTLGPIIFQRGQAANEETIGDDEVMARFTEKILRERPYLAPIKDRLAIPYACEDATFIAALKGACDPYPEFESGVTAQRMVEAAYESARSGVTVTVKT
jgi:predicted dehydrogenase